MPTFVELIPRLPVRNLRRTIEFYTDCLGFTPDVVWPDDNPTFAILRRDSTSLGFFEPNEHQVGQIGYAELYIHVTDSLAIHAAIRSKTEIEWGPEIYSYGRREFAFRDPDDYLVIVTEPTEESPTTSEPGPVQSDELEIRK